MSSHSLQYIKDVLSGNNSDWKYEHNVLSLSSDPWPSSTQSIRYISNCFHSSNIKFPLINNNANKINCTALYHSDSSFNSTNIDREPLSDVLSLSITTYNNDTISQNTDNEFTTCNSPLLFIIPHHNNHSAATQQMQCFMYNESAHDWFSSSCITISQSTNATQCACYTNNMHYNSSNQILSFMLSESQSIGFNDLISEFGIYDNTQICLASIIFVSIWWFLSLILYCISPIHDDVPLISKNVVIPSQFRYRMFTHTKEGRINDLLRHRTGSNLCRRMIAITCVYCDNDHLCCSLWRRSIGTNIYHGERVLFLLFHALLVAFLSLFLILLTQNGLIAKTYDDLSWMFIIASITLIIMQSLLYCVASSTPNRLTTETIDALVESERHRITAMQEEKARASLPKKRAAKTFDAQYWNHKFNFAEKEIEKVIHNDLESRSLPADVAQWSVSQVGIWVHSLGLGRYQSEFEHHRINGKCLLRLHLADIKQYVTEKKDVEFFHSRLHKLKQKWRYRYVSLRERRKKAKANALKIAQQQKEQREKMLQQVRMKSINTQIEQNTVADHSVPDVAATIATKRDSHAFVNLKQMFINVNKRSFDKSVDESKSKPNNEPAHINTSAAVMHQQSLSAIRTPITSRLAHIRSQITSLKNVYGATPVPKSKTKRKRTGTDTTKGSDGYNVDVHQINRYLNYFEEEDRNINGITLMTPQMSAMSTMNSASLAEQKENNKNGDNRYSATIGSETLQQHMAVDGGKMQLFQPSIDLNSMNDIVTEDVEIEVDLYGDDEYDLPLDSDNDTEEYDMDIMDSESKQDVIEWPQTNKGPTQTSMNAPKPIAMWNTQQNHAKQIPRNAYNKQLPQINTMNRANPQKQYVAPQMNTAHFKKDNTDYVNFNPNAYYHNQNNAQQQGRGFSNQNYQNMASNSTLSSYNTHNTTYAKALPLSQPKALGPKPPKPKPLPLATAKPLPGPPPSRPPANQSLDNRNIYPNRNNRNNINNNNHRAMNDIPPPPKSTYIAPVSPMTRNFKHNPILISSNIKMNNTLNTPQSDNSELTETDSEIFSENITPIPETPTNTNTNSSINNIKQVKKRKILLPSHNPNAPTYYKQQAKQNAIEEQKADKPDADGTGFTPVITPENPMNIFLPKTDEQQTSVHEQKVSLVETLAESELNLTVSQHDFNEEPTAITASGTNQSATLTKSVAAQRTHIPSIDYQQAANKLGVSNLLGTRTPTYDSDVDFDENEEEKRHRVLLNNAAQTSSSSSAEEESIYKISKEQMKTKHQAHLSVGERLANLSINPPNNSLNILSETQEYDLQEDVNIMPIPQTLNIDPDINSHNRVESLISVQTVETMDTMNDNAFGEGDFVDLILRDSNNLIVVGLVASYNTMSNLADVRILPSKSHNRGNEVERFVEASDLRYKGFRINDLAVLQFGQLNIQYPSGFDLDYEQFREDDLFPDEIVDGWQNGRIPKPTAFELFDGLKCRIKEVNPTGVIIVTILPSTRAQTYLLGQRSIKIGIEHILSLRVYHEKKEQRLEANKELEEQIDAFGLDSDVYNMHHHKVQTSEKGTPVQVAAQQLGFNVAPLLQKRQTTDRSEATTGGLERIKTEHVFAAMNHAEHNAAASGLNTIPSSIELQTSDFFKKMSLHNKESDATAAHAAKSLHDVSTLRSIGSLSGDSTILLNEMTRQQMANVRVYSNNAFAADKDVIRSDFIQRRKIMRYHYSVNRCCRWIINCFVLLLCIYFSIWLISEMHLAKYGILNNNNNNNNFIVENQCHDDDDDINSYAFDSSTFTVIKDTEWYWFTFTLITILIYNAIVSIAYYSISSCCLILRQRAYKKCRLDPCLIPCIACFYSNRYRRHKVKESQLAETIELQVAAISHNGDDEDQLSSLSRARSNQSENISSLCLCCVSQIKLQESLGPAENKSIEQITNHFMEMEDYANADLCFTLFCCYCRCFNAFHYGFNQPPNAAHLLLFFDPIKTKEDTL